MCGYVLGMFSEVICGYILGMFSEVMCGYILGIFWVYSGYVFRSDV